MIVNRRTFVVKRGRFEEAVALFMAEIERTNTVSRVYVPETGLFDTIAMEQEYESLEEYEKDLSEYFASPEAAQFLEKWYDLTETGGTNEIWRLAE
ncbi:MAG: hypothetical protein KAV87_02610 [Desulfobacteraceae bacterium]|nr:hypothetical protein [Desulfobacteraceae bacterium]